MGRYCDWKMSDYLASDSLASGNSIEDGHLGHYGLRMDGSRVMITCLHIIIVGLLKVVAKQTFLHISRHVIQKKNNNNNSTFWRLYSFPLIT